MNCLCGSGQKYEDCCGPLHSGRKKAMTAEQLMRSRFTAYAMGKDQYLIDTWDKTKSPDKVNFSGDQVEWSRLEIVSRKKGGSKDRKGSIEFKAYYKLNGEEHLMREASQFRKVNNEWIYVDGVVKSINSVGRQTDLGKNARCSCGSGKKYKRCCGKRPGQP